MATGKQFDFLAPRRIAFGLGALAKLPELVSPWGSPTLLVTGIKALKSSGGLDQILHLLEEGEIEVVHFPGVEADPGIETVDGGAEICLKKGCRSIIGVGGGSVIDCAKAVSGMVTNGGSVRDYLEGEKEITEESLPFIAVPTTSGTGAEATKNAVITNRQKGYKRSIRHQYLIPDIALVDPELTFSLPGAITASTGMDALAQLIEPYVSKKANPLTDALALSGINLIGKNLIRAYENGRNEEARTAMSMASLMSGLVLANSGLGLAHALSHPLGAHFSVPHGIGCAIMLPAVMEFNLETSTEKYARVAEALGAATAGMDRPGAARKGLELVRAISEKIGISPHLSDWGIKEKDLALIARESKGSSRNGNPRKATDEECVEILRRAL